MWYRYNTALACRMGIVVYMMADDGCWDLLDDG
jgi:hypothetical protein